MNKYLEGLIKENTRPIIFDYDGVLFEARWYKDRINMRNETEEKLLESMKCGENLYTAPIPFMIDFVKKLNSNIFVLSHMHNDIEYKAKCEQISKYYPNIVQDHILKAPSSDDKIQILEWILKEYGPFIYIDDMHPALIKFENYFCDKCKFFHVSSLYV